MVKLQLPKYDKVNKVHKRIASLSKKAHKYYDDDRKISIILNELDELYLSLFE